jgi:hypothetical protein
MASCHVTASLKTDAQRPFSVILKHVIVSGINGFESGTNGSSIKSIFLTSLICVSKYSCFFFFFLHTRAYGLFEKCGGK